MPRPMVVSLSLLTCVGACTGSIGEAPTNHPAPAGDERSADVAPAAGSVAAPAPVSTGSCAPLETPARLRRLSGEEYQRTVAALLNRSNLTTVVFPGEREGPGFTNDARLGRVTDLLVERLRVSAEENVGAAVASGPSFAAFVGCDPAQAGEETCARRFLGRFATSAYRRPATNAELDRLVDVYRVGRSGTDFKAGVGLAMQVVLQSPKLLFRTELGGPEATGDVVTLTPYEVASEISYLSAGEPPDAELLAAAARGDELLDPNARERQMRRLLTRPSAKTGFGAFAAQWLEVDEALEQKKDPKLYPAFGAALAAAMKRETEMFAAEVAFGGDGKLETLLTADFTYGNRDLAKLYGLPAPATSDFQRLSWDANRRAGLLTQAGVLTVHAAFDEASPSRRGKLVRTQVLCQALPPPPPEIAINLPPPGKTLTNRQRHEQHHATDPQCAGCHSFFDPIGFAFENYDAIGAYRSADAGKPVDATGTLTGTRDADGPFTNAIDLVRRLGKSAQARSCFARQWTSHALARPVVDEERCAVETLSPEFVSGQATIQDLIVALVRSRAFVLRRVGGGK